MSENVIFNASRQLIARDAIPQKLLIRENMNSVIARLMNENVIFNANDEANDKFIIYEEITKR